MLFQVNRNPSGDFRLARDGERASYEIEITNPYYGADGFWNKNLVSSAVLRFKDGETQWLIFHPGARSDNRHLILNFADLLVRVGLITLVGVEPELLLIRALGVPKNAVYAFRDVQQMKEHFYSASNYPAEGYYIGTELILREALYRSQF